MHFENFSFPSSSGLQVMQNRINTAIRRHNEDFFGANLKLKGSKEYELAQQVYEEAGRISGYQGVSPAIRYHDFYELHDALRNDAVWCALIQKFPAVAQYEKEWKNHALYSHLTTKALFSAYSELESLALLTALAQHEFLKRKYQKKFYTNSYKHYLTDLASKITEAKKAIAEGLAYRLKIVYATKDLRQHNPLKFLLDQFQNHTGRFYENCLGNEFIDGAQEPFPLAKVYAFIDNHMDEKIGASIKERYFRLTQNPPLGRVKTRRHGEIFFLVPEKLAQHIPSFPRWFNILLPGYALIYSFFHDKEPLLFQLFSLYHSVELSSQGGAKWAYWQELDSLQKVLMKEKEAANTLFQKSWFSWLHKLAAFSRDWEHFIHSQQQWLAKQQLDCFASMAEVPLPLAYAYDYSPQILEIKNSILQALENFRVLINQGLVSSEETKAFKEIQEHLTRRWALTRSFSPIEPILSLLSQGVSIPPIKFDLGIKTLELKSQKKLALLAKEHKKSIYDILDQINNFLRSHIINLRIPSADKQRSFSQSVKIISHFALIPLIKNSLLLHSMEISLTLFIKSYFERIKNRSPEVMRQEREKFAELDNGVGCLLQLTPVWKEIREEWFKLKAMHCLRLQEKIPFGKEKFSHQWQENLELLGLFRENHPPMIRAL